jgi:tRNA(Arg) A34 adenosine deaminase TadA
MDRIDYMRRAIALSRAGVEGGFGGPFGCVIVRNGEIVGEGHNEVLASKDPTAHAEMLAIRRASARLGSFDLSGCELYTNGTPCCMCMSASLWARIHRIYYALAEKDSAAIGLGDRHFYEEVGRPLNERQIIPMINLPGLNDEAFAVYRLWSDKPDRVDY